jgi:enoyl-CoA hydratase/carnithine racemase
VGLPETSLAIIPGASGTQMLPRLVPVSTAKRMIYFGERLSTSQAKENGLVDFEVENYSNGLEEVLNITSKLNSQVIFIPHLSYKIGETWVNSREKINSWSN